jgi:GNAT superfamily N-acetyltransferase
MPEHRVSTPRLQVQEVTAESAAEITRQSRDLLLEYGRFVAAQPPIASFSWPELQQEAAELPHSYLNAGGGVLLAFSIQGPVGFVAYRPLPGGLLPTAWELKRLWVRPQARGLSVGRTLVEAVLQRATAAGKTHLVLDTAPASMAAAHRLYLDMGFLPCAPYTDPPTPGIEYMSLEIPVR